MLALLQKWKGPLLFLFGGGISAGLKLLITYLLRETPIQIAYVITLIIVFVVNFVINYFVVFAHNKGKSLIHSMWKYTAAYFFFMACDYGLVLLLNLVFEVFYLLAVVLSTVGILVFKYYVYNTKVFSKH